MACAAGPDVSESGLVLALDAADRYSFTLTSVEVLVVAGGGGGGTHHGGGGGAGGLIYNSNVSVTPGSAVTVTVGGGGGGQPAGANQNGSAGNGGNSVFGVLTAIGGGGGGNCCSGNGAAGGSGGGAHNWQHYATGGSATSGQGFAGASNNGTINYGGGGGGAGGTAGGLSNNSGGPGLYFAQFSSVGGSPAGWFAGGGGAGVYPGYANDTSYGYGGVGGGGNGGNGPHSAGTTPTAGGTNTGGGGGGVADLYQNGAGGGSGIVIVRYPGPQRAIGGTVTFSGGHTIHTFTTVGSATFTPLSASNGNAVLGLSDLSGRGNFGTTANSPTYSSANGGSVVFNGSNQYVDLGNPSSLSAIGGTTNITVSSWVYYTAYGGGQSYSVITVKGFPWTWLLENPSNTFRFRISAGGSDVAVPDTSTHLLNTWYNVVGTYDGSNMRIYVNGVLKNTLAQTGTLATNTETAKIGTYEGTSYNLTGRVSNVSIYNRALTAAEISQNFNSLRGRFGI